MRPLRPASVLFSLALLVATPAGDGWARRAPPPWLPLLEALVRGEPLPERVPAPGDPPRTASHVLGDADRQVIQELVRAHVENDPAPLRKALDEGPPWLVRVALESLATTRIDTLPWNAVRREDEAFVRGFLPDLVRLSGDPDLRMPAMEALRDLAVHGLDEKSRAAAWDALLSRVVGWGDDASLALLGRLLQAAPDREIPARHQEGLRGVLLEHLQRPPTVAWRVAVAVRSEDLVAAVRKHLDHLREAGRGANGDVWLPFLAAAGHPDTPPLVVEALSRPRAPGLGGSISAALTAATILPDASYVPALETFPVTGWDEPLKAIAAIDDPAARALLELWARSGHHDAAVRWLALDPATALPWLRKEASEGTPERRASALRLLASAGETDLLPAIRSLLAQKMPAWVRGNLHATLADVVRHTSDPAARELALATARKEPSAAVMLLEAVHHQDPEQVETLLLARLGTLPAAPDGRHVRVIDGLGRVGGERSLAALAPWTRWRQPSDPNVYDLHLDARVAVGRIERRLER